MITTADQFLADHEATHRHAPWVFVRPRGFQPGVGSIPGRMLYNVVGGEYALGSTVTMETLLGLGFRVEVVM